MYLKDKLFFFFPSQQPIIQPFSTVFFCFCFCFLFLLYCKYERGNKLVTMGYKKTFII